MQVHVGFQANLISVLTVTICLEAIGQYSVLILQLSISYYLEVTPWGLLNLT